MELSLDPRTTATVLIDLQQGITAHNVAPHSAAQVVANGVRLASEIQLAGGIIVLVHVDFGADGAGRLAAPVDAPMSRGAAMPADWAAFVPEVAALRADVVIVKRQWGAFYGTELDLQLRRRGVTSIVLGGIATNFGVESTAREAWQHNYAVVIAEDACTSMSAAMHQFAVDTIFPRLSRVRSTAAILAAVAGNR
ncbi:MAG TPA: hydrolase [Gemmatimonadales bacterium]|jgi:nicotinamidase-related amidase